MFPFHRQDKVLWCTTRWFTDSAGPAKQENPAILCNKCVLKFLRKRPSTLPTRSTYLQLHTRRNEFYRPKSWSKLLYIISKAPVDFDFACKMCNFPCPLIMASHRINTFQLYQEKFYSYFEVFLEIKICNYLKWTKKGLKLHGTIFRGKIKQLKESRWIRDRLNGFLRSVSQDLSVESWINQCNSLDE